MAARPGHRRDARGERGARPGQGLIGAAVAAWPAVALVGSYELLMMVIRNAQAQEDAADTNDGFPADHLYEEAVHVFAEELRAARIPSVRAIRARLHVGQPRAQRIRCSSPRSMAYDHEEKSGPEGLFRPGVHQNPWFLTAEFALEDGAA